MLLWCLHVGETYGAGAVGSDEDAFGPKEPFMGGVFGLFCRLLGSCF